MKPTETIDEDMKIETYKQKQVKRLIKLLNKTKSQIETLISELNREERDFSPIKEEDYK